MTICACKFDNDKVIEPCAAHVAWAREYCKPTQFKVHDVEEFYKEPDPWEAWVERMPVTLDGKLDIIDTHAFRDWFREMPRGK